MGYLNMTVIYFFSTELQTLPSFRKRLSEFIIIIIFFLSIVISHLKYKLGVILNIWLS